MNILLLGANGQLGRSFIEHGGLAAMGSLTVASRDGQCFDGSAIEAVDLAVPGTLTKALDKLQPTVIVNAAAYTAVDRAEDEEGLATLINGEAVGVLGDWAQRHHALVVHYSTDYVFDGSSTSPYAINAPTAPLGAYGRSKLAGEKALRASGARHFIFRTSWVYSAHGHNFLRTMLRLGAERDQLGVVADQVGSPTPTSLLVTGSLAALQQWHAARDDERRESEGTHHLVANGETSWHGFASAIFDTALDVGLMERRPVVQAIATADFPTRARRPAYSVLDNSDFEQRFAFTLPTWQQGLFMALHQLALNGS
ncbi:dTDP-4-dehydrorhamnose reductase [Dyella silvae]|uniref:dTDP-4-dehydrorhamnose reductase n=1 Tax=Dyella silvae TaxID=2994424 RepID=UPI0022645BDF|nr:dTDP-4-dehydrorhamnose reductase [Dyella silvae]